MQNDWKTAAINIKFKLTLRENYFLKMTKYI